VTGDLDVDDEKSTTPAWHERTPTLVGASVAALLALLIMYFAVSCVAQEFNTPDEGPQYFIDPGAPTSSGFYGSTTSGSSASTSYSLIPPQTTDINPGDSTTTTTTTDTSSPRGDSTTTRRRPPSGDDDSTTSRRPRFNQTRPVFRPIDPYNP
jgi:hypothetical protein